MKISSNDGAAEPKGSHVRDLRTIVRGARPSMQDVDFSDTPAARIDAQVQIWIVRYRLTPREAEVLSKAAASETPAQMTGSLGIAPATVHKHRENLLRKTGDDSLPMAANRLLLEALGEACKEKHRPTP